MNSDQLLEALRNGAQLKVRWKPRSLGITRPKLQFRLTLSDSTVIPTQASTVKPLLKRRWVYEVLWSGGERDYHLVESEQAKEAPHGS